ncbi:MAG: hydrogenase [Chloroflexi bacterium RBG_16_57_8]|nr:MAG: hydrogenase [Chloroflexi bacterium RBG_16_57_8]
MDNERIDRIIDKHEPKPGSLIQVLLDIQSENHWLPRHALERVSLRLNVPMNKVMHSATFHKTFTLVPEGKHEVHVCNGTSCHVRGALRILDVVQEMAGVAPGETDPDMKFSLKSVSCMGRCQTGPVMVVDGEHHGKMEPGRAEELLKECR